MGFQEPPTLPDYSKLIFALNQSGAQKWNPAVYQILKQLIEAVQQSQNVLAPQITNITGGGISAVAVDPNGAILGDGTSGSPLKTNPDGVTIQIVGNQLTATAGLVAFGQQDHTIWANGVGAFTILPNTQVMVIPAVAGSVILPIKLYLSSHQDDAGGNNALWSPTTGYEVVYNTTGFPVIGTPGADVFFGAVGTHDQSSVNEPVASLIAGAISNAYRAKSVIVRTSNTINCVSTAGRFIHNSAVVAIAYLLVACDAA